MRLTETQLRRVVKRIVAETAAAPEPPPPRLTRDEFARRVSAERESLKGKTGYCSECGDIAPADVIFSTGGACAECAGRPLDY